MNEPNPYKPESDQYYVWDFLSKHERIPACHTTIEYMTSINRSINNYSYYKPRSRLVALRNPDNKKARLEIAAETLEELKGDIPYIRPIADDHLGSIEMLIRVKTWVETVGGIVKMRQWLDFIERFSRECPK